MSEEMQEKNLVISPVAVQKLQAELQAGHHYKIEIAAFN